MIRSMTGFGRAAGIFEGEPFTVEMSAVNHKFFECSVRLPYAWTMLEAPLRDAIKRQVLRGKINVVVRRERGFQGRPSIKCDVEVARQYLEAARRLTEVMHATEVLSLNTLVRLDGVFFQEEDAADLEQVESTLAATLLEALSQFNRTRDAEGAALRVDLLERIDAMRAALAEVESQLPALAKAYEDKLRARLLELNADVNVKEERIALEMAMMADKMDVNEEVVRLKAHFEHATALMDGPEAAGRELTFLSQEFQREINTLGSKLRDIGVTREVLRMKSELEKLREQTANIE